MLLYRYYTHGAPILRLSTLGSGAACLLLDGFAIGFNKTRKRLLYRYYPH